VLSIITRFYHKINTLIERHKKMQQPLDGKLPDSPR
jgi:hypothetical protein